MPHTPARVRRASTTQKITQDIYSAIQLALAYGDGVIVRHRGHEIGIIGAAFGSLKTLAGDWLDPKQCTIRKGTAEAIRADYDHPVAIMREAIA